MHSVLLTTKIMQSYRNFLNFDVAFTQLVTGHVSASSPGPTVTVAWVLRGKHSRKRAVGPGRKCRKKCMIQRKSDKIVFY